MTAQNLKRKKNNHLKDQKRTRTSKVSAIINQKQLEQELKTTHEHLNHLLKSTSIAIYTCKASGDYGATSITDNVKQITGYESREFVVHSSFWINHVHPEDRQRILNELPQIFEQGSYIHEYRFLNKDGTYKWIQDEMKLMRDRDGNPSEIIGYWIDITKQKKAEETLMESGQKYRELTNFLPEAVYEANENGKILFANRCAFEIFGYTQEDFDKGLYLFEMVIPENRQKVLLNMQRLFKGENVIGNEYTALRKNGSTFPIFASVNLIVQNNKPIGVRGVVVDITEHKQAENALRSERNKFRGMLLSINDGVDIVNKDYIIEFQNEILQKQFGDKTGEKCYAVYMGLKEPCHFCSVQEAIKTGRATRVEFVGKDGRSYELNSSPFTDVDGNVKVIELVRDITERKQAEENLKESEEKYRLLVEESLQGIVIGQGNPPRLVFANPSMTMILGYTYEELSSLSPEGIESLVHPEDRAFFFKNYKDRLEGKLVLPRYEIRGIRKDGRLVWLELSSTRIEYKGQPAVQAAFIDITERKQAEEALRESEERYRTILENIEDGYYEVDLPGNFTFFNDSLCRMLGYSKDEMMGMGNQQYTDQENRKKLFQAFNSVYRVGGSIKGFDWEVFRKDGTKLFSEVSVSLIKDSKGQPIGFRGIARDITERKQVEKALRTEKQRFQTLSEQAPFGMVMIGQDGTFRYMNPKFKELFGYDLTDIPDGKTWFRKAYPDPTYRHHVIETWIKDLEIFQPEEKRSEVFTVTCKDGTIKIINFIPVQLETGENLMACEDITEAKRSEESLEKSEMRFMELFNEAPMGYFEYNVEGIITNVNRTYLEMLGYKFEEMIGKPVWKFIVENEVARQQILGKLAGTIPPARGIERVYRRKDGTTLSVLVEDRILRDSAGKITGIRATIHDITERKHAEEALRESEAKYRQLVEYAPIGIFEIDLNTLKFLNVNDVMCEVMGYSKEEFLSMSPLELLTEEGRNLLAEGMEKMLSGEKTPDSVEVKLRTKDKNEFWALVNTKVFYKDGKPFKAQVVAQDISERKRLEEQLIQSQKMEAVGQLAGGIAHDFNNLLTVIKGYGQLSLLDLKESDPLWGNIQEIQKATQRASDLTRQLLAFSRRQILDLKVLNLNSLVRDLNKMLRRIIGEDIELITLFNEDLGRVKVDPGQIEQMILNLAVNARDAMPSGGKLIIETKNVEIDVEYVAAHMGLTPGGYVRLSVSDTGVGMSQEIMEKAFEPFFTTKEMGKGTGLGLATVYGIVKQSGGSVQVYSEPGFGTTFNIFLPRVEENLDALDLQEEPDLSPKGSETVLLVEDESSVRNLAYRILSQQGYTVLEAANGDEALRIVQEGFGKKIDLLLTDVVMPRMSGKELADRIKTLKPELKVLFTSGYTDDAIVHHGILTPGTHFLQKPFSPKVLSLKVREVLDR